MELDRATNLKLGKAIDVLVDRSATGREAIFAIDLAVFAAHFLDDPLHMKAKLAPRLKQIYVLSAVANALRVKASASGSFDVDVAAACDCEAEVATLLKQRAVVEPYRQQFAEPTWLSPDNRDTMQRTVAF